MGVPSFFSGRQRQIDQEGTSGPVKSFGMFIVAFSDHVCGFFPCILFGGPVPQDDSPLRIDHKSRIGEEVENFRRLSLGIAQGLLGPIPFLFVSFQFPYELEKGEMP